MSHIFSKSAISLRTVAEDTPISYFLRSDFDQVIPPNSIYSSTIILRMVILRASIFFINSSKLDEYLPWLRSIGWSYNTHFFQNIHNSTRTGKSKTKLSLKHRGRSFLFFTNKLYSGFDNLWIFIKASTRYSSFKITTISKNNRRILKALKHTWINCKAYFTNNIVHLIGCNEYSLHTISFSRTTWVIEHIPITEKILCSTTVKNGT